MVLDGYTRLVQFAESFLNSWIVFISIGGALDRFFTTTPLGANKNLTLFGTSSKPRQYSVGHDKNEVTIPRTNSTIPTSIRDPLNHTIKLTSASL